ncbi:glycosyltransferase [Streptomyces sp. NPDC055060]
MRAAHYREAAARGGARPAGPLRIVRLANFVAPASGGLRTALRELGRGYRAAGHDPVLIVPGARADVRDTDQGRVVTLPGTPLPGTGGYRVLADRRRVARVLEQLAPDRIEVSDRTTLRWTGAWARHRRIPAVMVSHETAHGVLSSWGVPERAVLRAADALNARTAHAYARVVCTTEWAEREFVRIGARNVVRAPLGVDLAACRPALRDPRVRARHAREGEVLLALCSRLSVEKRPGTALDALEALRGRGVPAVLVVAGDGPLRARLELRAHERRLPVTFLGHVEDRTALGELQAAADVCLAPGPCETFGLAALEALACGTPVVVSASSALPEIVGGAGEVATDSGAAFASAAQALLARPERSRRHSARARAECFGWEAAVAAFLGAHEAGRGAADAEPAPAGAESASVGADSASTASEPAPAGAEPASGESRSAGGWAAREWGAQEWGAP